MRQIETVLKSKAPSVEKIMEEPKAKELDSLKQDSLKNDAKSSQGAKKIFYACGESIVSAPYFNETESNANAAKDPNFKEKAMRGTFDSGPFFKATEENEAD